MAMIGRESERQQESEAREVHLGRSVDEARSSAVEQGTSSLFNVGPSLRRRLDGKCKRSAEQQGASKFTIR